MVVKTFKSIYDYVDKKIDEQTTQLRAEFSYLPTKDDFYTMMDELMGELKAIREELPVLSHQTSRNSDRITALESIHPSGKHLS